MAWLCSSVLASSVMAQPGGAPGPRFDAAMTKLFADNPNFSAITEFHISRPPGGDMSMTGKMEISDGKTRFEMNMADVKGGNLPPQAMAQMKQMGMSRMIAINRPDKNSTLIIYPDLKGYTETVAKEAAPQPADYKMSSAKIGTETVDGHPCVKYNVTVTGLDGVEHKSTLWKATDLHDFPVKIEAESPQTGPVVMYLKNVKVGKPPAADFEAPSGFEKADSMTTLMMKGMKGAPPQ